MAGGSAAARLIEKATNTTEREVDPRLLKAIKATVRSSDDELQAAVGALMAKMKKEHAQVRYLAVLIIDELFMRSKLFRSLLMNIFDQLLSLSIGFRRNMPLPPPSNIASVLRSKSIELLEKWHASFGVHYRQLRLGFEYLKNTLRYQFPNRLEHAARLQQERKDREERSKEIMLNKFNNLRENYSSIKSEIQSTLDQLGECLEIVQNRHVKFVSSSSLEDDDADPEISRSSALWQIRQESLREGEKVIENSENAAIFDALRELYKLLVSSHLSSVQEWISVLIRVDLADNTFRNCALKQFIDIRNVIQSAKKRCEELGCALPITGQDQAENDIWEEGKIEVPDHDGSNFCEITDGGYASSLVINGWNHREKQDYLQNPYGKFDGSPVVVKGGDQAQVIEGLPSDETNSIPSAQKSKLLAEAPIVKWGPFLESWGSNHDAMVNYRGLELESHWGRVDQDATIPAEKVAELSAQWCLYEEQTAEIRPCLAPLRNGRLCQRRDLSVCPFHGPIVPRDSNGNPVLTKSKCAEDLADANPQDAMGHGHEEDTMTEEGKKEPYKHIGCSSSNVENSPRSDKDLMKQLAKQAVKNVRERDKETRSSKRAKLAKIREHNEVVLREAACTCTSLSTSTEQGTTSDAMLIKAKKPTLSSMLRKKVTAKDRLTQRLLKARVADAAIKQLMQSEDVNYRESYPNQW